jgi:glucokinase
MPRAIGVLAMEHIAVGLVEDGTLAAPIRVFPPLGSSSVGLHAMPPDKIAETIKTEILAVAGDREIEAVGIGFPGIIRGGVVQDSPNLRQVKGFKLQATLDAMLSPAVPVHVLNDADAVAAGIAAKLGHLGALIRVWTLGSGVGYGRYPATDGVWEGGHIVVSLDPREKYCGCGGVGHLEGIVGGRAMRLRFLDREPDEVFSDAKTGDERDLASRARRSDGHERPPGWPRPAIRRRSQCAVRRAQSTESLPARNGQTLAGPGQRDRNRGRGR